jgi:hypothetical protein
VDNTDRLVDNDPAMFDEMRERGDRASCREVLEGWRFDHPRSGTGGCKAGTLATNLGDMHTYCVAQIGDVVSLEL